MAGDSNQQPSLGLGRNQSRLQAGSSFGEDRICLWATESSQNPWPAVMAGGWKDPFQYHSRESLSWGSEGKGVLSCFC